MEPLDRTAADTALDPPSRAPALRPASPALRRRLLIATVTVGGLGAVAIAFVEARREAIADWLLADAAQTGVRAWLVTAGIAVLFLPLVGAAAYLWILGARTRRELVFPPEGVAVVRDTRILTGRAAERRGRAAQLAGALLGLAAVGLPLAIGLILRRLLA